MIVLAVDDERDVTESIAASLKLKGHEVLCAESADSAMKILQNRFQSREPVSVILSAVAKIHVYMAHLVSGFW